jgi:uncharacterized lipoprotein YddW (UPF0748 family)
MNLRAATLYLLSLFPAAVAYAQPPVRIERAAASFDRSGTIDVLAARAGQVDAATVRKVRQAGSLEGAIGWFEYDFTVPATGWYEVTVAGHAAHLETLIDPRGADPAKAGAYVPGSLGFNGKDDKVGNFFLNPGKHTVRLQRLFWTGFPKITGLTVTASDGRLGTRVSVTRPSAYGVFRKGECGTLKIAYGPQTAASVLPIQLVNATTSNVIRPYQLTLPATSKHDTLDWPVPCDAEGAFVLYFHDPRAGIEQRDVQQFTYDVTDVKAPPPRRPLQKVLIQDIDTVSSQPDYAAGETRIAGASGAEYRESGDRGWLDQQQPGAKTVDASWFAYVLKGLAPQQPYMVEVDYPDDAPRTFAIALRESSPLSYPVAAGIDGGGDFPVSGRMQTHRLIFWPRAREPRIVFLPAHNGKRAAASKIRVYRLDGNLPALVPPTPGTRQFVNWYEEGTSFLGMYGAPTESPAGTKTALQRWAEAAAYVGVDTLWPTVVIYNFALYPSVFNVHFSQPWTSDQFRQLLMVAEQHRLKVIAEVHPRADELTWTTTPEPGLRSHFLASKNGQNRKDVPPFHNPLHPKNQDWYLGMIGELAERYRDSPALQGISLRFMQWKNPAFTNFHSLDWGYDDYTVALFERETGVKVPFEAGASNVHALRYRWLMANARERWVDWRCQKITAFITRIRDRVRAVRPDLMIYIPVFPMDESGGVYHAGTAWIREAGIDAPSLARLQGVAMVNSLHVYGRRFGPPADTILRNHLVSAASQRAVSTPGNPALFLPTAMYFEAIEAVAPPQRLGFPANTKQTWMAAVLNPPGRQMLERHAVLLADTDAAMLGDGGNGYTLGQPELQEFLAEYRRLPAARFKARTDARAPVAVWDLERSQDYWVYAVNRTPKPVDVTITTTGAGKLTRVSSQDEITGPLQLTLQPYQLVAYRAPATLRVTAISSR